MPVTTYKALEPVHHPLVTHVNMQLDTLIANATPDDLRAIARTLLATGPPGMTTFFTNVAKTRIQFSAPRNLAQPSALFSPFSIAVPVPSGKDKEQQTRDVQSALPTQALWDSLAKARCLFGVGLGFDSLPLLASIVRAAIPYYFVTDSELEKSLFAIDTDIAQGLQSCKEQLASGSCVAGKDREDARLKLNELKKAVADFEDAVEEWGGEFPLERSEMALATWKL